jgi:gamma-glutamyl:cysteine ligase YbdK (ATP-grasp superfamily)
MLAHTSDIGGPIRAGRRSSVKRLGSAIPTDGGVGAPVRRIGLEQEFFLVDRTGRLCDQADLFLRRCREVAVTKGLDPLSFKAECVKSLIEITTPPSPDLMNLADAYLDNLALALEVASELGLDLYPLGNYPLATTPEIRDDPSTSVQARTIGPDRFLHAGRCAGTHLHLELPAGTVWPNVKVALGATGPRQRELLDLYNLATALDPALVALTRACPFYEGLAVDYAARTVHYRGMLGLSGLYTNLQEVGALGAYAARVDDFIVQQNERYRAWFAAMDAMGVDSRLFVSTSGNLHRASWNPVRLNHHGTVEIRSMDANFPAAVLSVCALICGAVDRLRRERLRVRPSRQVRTLEVDGDALLVPAFPYLSGELLGAAVTNGVRDERIRAYLDSFFRFAYAYVGEPDLVEILRGAGGGYKTTEDEVSRSFPHLGATISGEQGLWLVEWSCRQLREQVFSLRQRQQKARNGGGYEEGDRMFANAPYRS